MIRHYFNGLAEEVRKVGVTSVPDPSDFDFHVELDGSGTPSGWPSPTAGPLDLVTDWRGKVPDFDGKTTCTGN